MGTKNQLVDTYIAKSADFAKPILSHLRKLVHTGCPGVVENIKWGLPSFEYKGMLCGMAAFKAHCAFGFWKSSIMPDPNKIMSEADSAMGSLGRLRELNDLPPDKILLKYIRAAARLNDEGIKVERKPLPRERKPLRVPPALKRALSNNKKARETFENFNYTNKKEYIEWLTEAKTAETRSKRLSTAVGWMAEGKARNWKYVRK